MALSRLRLRLTAGFAVAFLVGTVILESAGYVYINWTGSHDFNERLKEGAASAHTVIRREFGRVNVDSTVFDGVKLALRDLTPSRLAFVVYDSTGKRLASGGDSIMVQHIPSVDVLPKIGEDIDEVHLGNGHDMRYADDTVASTRVVAAATTDLLRRRQRNYGLRLAVLLPIIVFLALGLGYFLTRFALAPIDALGHAADAISPQDVGRRLPVHDPPDELDQLATRFNRLLDRIQGLQEQSHHFLREVAHQIRTPLTLVVGETELGLERDRTPAEYVDTLRRVHAAAGQMTHRMHDLLLLARMEAGERPPLRDRVELDAIALEATDMFRARARTLGQRLQLAEIAHCDVLGDEALLREGLLELLENACRHGEPGPPVAVSVRCVGEFATIEVRNTGAAVPLAPRPPAPSDDEVRNAGMGLSIMRWIASVHGGEFQVRREGRENVVGFRLPVAAEGIS
jgi:signal transduction histidine kinase